MLTGGISRESFLAAMVSSLEEQQSLERELLNAKVDKLSAAALARLDEVHSLSWKGVFHLKFIAGKLWCEA
jgi:hypothetical protein